MIYCKTFDRNDYNRLPEHVHIQSIHDLLINRGAPARFEHPHRLWEYSLVLNALRANNTKSIIDVGGGGSVFAPATAWVDIAVSQIDPGDCSTWVSAQSAVINRVLPYIQIDFMNYQDNVLYDAVTCISVIEHVGNDLEFVARLAKSVKPNGLLAITCDFHPSGIQRIGGHVRTYNEASLMNLLSAAGNEFKPFGSGWEYIYRGEDVNNYTFASLILKREG